MKIQPKTWLIILSVLVVLIAIVLSDGESSGKPVVINQIAVPPVPALRADKVAEGEILYVRYCAECHGADLKGSPNWKKSLADGSLPPPPQDETGHTWHHSDNQLIQIVRDGGDIAYNSKMPAFGDKFNEDEIVSILEFLKSKWDVEAREFQWWVSVRPE